MTDPSGEETREIVRAGTKTTTPQDTDLQLGIVQITTAIAEHIRPCPSLHRLGSSLPPHPTPSPQQVRAQLTQATREGVFYSVTDVSAETSRIETTSSAPRPLGKPGM